jgi:serine/threonine protein phosphatase 1
VAGVLAVAVHALIDFSVQIQAVGMTVAILLGAGFGEASRRARSRASVLADAPALVPAGGGFATERLLIPVTAGSNPHPADPQPPEGLRIYAFGDVHGRHDLLLRLCEAIREDCERRPPSDALVIGLGDYIDRGPHSREVIEALTSDMFGLRSIFLRGNHEQMLLDFLGDPLRHGPSWFHAGGRETLRSFGIGNTDSTAASDVGYGTARDLLAAKLSPEKIAFLERMPGSYRSGSYFFAHAGARPDVPLDRQAVQDLLWIREGFSDRDAPFDKMVVHGHVPVDRPFFGRYRINIDTGAYFTGRLTCLVLERTDRRILDLPPGPNPAAAGPIRLSQIAALHGRWDATPDPARESG